MKTRDFRQNPAIAGGRLHSFRYTPTTCFETFPFPDPTDEQRDVIAAAAKELDELRNNWLNPPEWTRSEVLEFPGSADGPWRRYIVEIGSNTGENSIEPGSVTPDPGLTESGSIARDEATTEDETKRDRSTGKARIGTVRYPRVVPKDEECAKQLKKRTLTNLYNQRPTWLDLVHRKLDEAVFTAYGWNPTISDDDLLAKLLELNLQPAE